ncbi:MAG TPA: dTMP kinase [Acidiferrobacter sp.]|nr:dTMP kinase [Acidiferrobacter sp.]
MNSTVTPKPLFITLEGLDGSGKGTQLDRVVSLCQRNHPGGLVVTREPGGTDVGERIRAVLLEHGKIEPESELLLMFAARVQHLKTVIEPALALGKAVVCDRYLDATYAYQGYGRGLSLALIDELVRLLAVRLPDLTLFFDVPVEVALARRSGRAVDRIEAEGAEFFARVRAGYRARAHADSGRFAVISAEGSPEIVGVAVEAALQRLW